MLSSFPFRHATRGYKGRLLRQFPAAMPLTGGCDSRHTPLCPASFYLPCGCLISTPQGSSMLVKNRYGKLAFLSCNVPVGELPG